MNEDFAMMRDGKRMKLVHTREIDVKNSIAPFECACGCGSPLSLNLGGGAVRRFVEDDSENAKVCKTNTKLHSSRVAAGAICRFQSTFSCRRVACPVCLDKRNVEQDFPARFRTSYSFKSQKDVGFDCVELVYSHGDELLYLYIAPIGVRPWEYENVKLSYEVSSGEHAHCFLLSAGNVLNACDFCRGFVAEILDFGLLYDKGVCEACEGDSRKVKFCCVCWAPVRFSFAKLSAPKDAVAHVHCVEKCSGCKMNYRSILLTMQHDDVRDLVSGLVKMIGVVLFAPDVFFGARCVCISRRLSSMDACIPLFLCILHYMAAEVGNLFSTFGKSILVFRMFERTGEFCFFWGCYCCSAIWMNKHIGAVYSLCFSCLCTVKLCERQFNSMRFKSRYQRPVDFSSTFLYFSLFLCCFVSLPTWVFTNFCIQSEADCVSDVKETFYRFSSQLISIVLPDLLDPVVSILCRSLKYTLVGAED